MPKTPGDIFAKVQQIYMLAKDSETPLAVLNMQGTLLLADRSWTPQEVEEVSGEVLELLIQEGWKKKRA